MLPTEELFVYVYVLVHDLMLARAVVVPGWPGPAPACSDAELLAIAVVRHLLGRRSESGSSPRSARDWGHLFPVLPPERGQPPTRWPWGAFEQLRIIAGGPAPGRRLPADRHVRAAGQAPLPGPRPGPAAPAPATTWPPGSAGRRPRRVVLRLPPRRQDRPGQPHRARVEHRARRRQRARRRRACSPGPPRATCSPTRASTAWPSPHRKPPAAPPSSSRPSTSPACPPSAESSPMRNRIETTFSEITDRMNSPGTRPHLLPAHQTAATIAAHTLLRVCLSHSTTPPTSGAGA